MKTILIVDDSSGVRKFVMFALKNHGYRVVEAEDGLDALEKLRFEKVDLVLTDLNMPHMDGFTLIRTLRQSPEYLKVPIIILTTEEGVKEQQMGMEAGANAYMIKPFKPSEILAKIKEFLP